MGRVRRIGLHVYVCPHAPTPEQLVNLLMVGGPLTVRDPSPELRHQWRRVIDAVRVGGELLRGHQLIFQGRDSGDLRIEIGTGPHPSLKYHERSEAFVIDHQCASGHAAVESVTTDASWTINDQLSPRARRLLEVLADAFEQRGHAVTAGYEGTLPALVVRIGDSRWTLRIEEENEVVDAYPPLEDLQRMYPWQRLQPHRIQRSTGRLRITSPAGRGTSSKHASWADRSRWALEDKLAEIVAELEHRRPH